MYFDLMGPHFVIAARNCVGREWYEALEYHWLALFQIIAYVMNFGWNLQRADEQRRARYVYDYSLAERLPTEKYFFNWTH